MSRYIEAEQLITEMEISIGDIYNHDIIKGIKIGIDLINSRPTADVVEVVHGEWIEHKYAEESEGLLISNYECNQCHSWKREESNYCPNCGAKMRSGDKLSPTGKKVQDDL